MKLNTDINSKSQIGINAELKRLEQKIIQAETATKEAASNMKSELIANLRSQGRDGGEPPPLSEITKNIYAQSGEPDGSAIENHIETIQQKIGGRQQSTVGIVAGKPSMIAKVQNEGATIPVTDKMRGFLSAVYGIHLRSTTTHIVIPGRHFWDKAYKKASEDLKNKLKEIFDN